MTKGQLDLYTWWSSKAYLFHHYQYGRWWAYVCLFATLRALFS